MLYLLSISMVIVFLMVITHHGESNEILCNSSNGVILRTYGRRKSVFDSTLFRVIIKSISMILLGGVLL